MNPPSAFMDVHASLMEHGIRGRSLCAIDAIMSICNTPNAWLTLPIREAFLFIITPNTDTRTPLMTMPKSMRSRRIGSSHHSRISKLHSKCMEPRWKNPTVRMGGVLPNIPKSGAARPKKAFGRLPRGRNFPLIHPSNPLVWTEMIGAKVT
jgi:hypothetical protein